MAQATLIQLADAVAAAINAAAQAAPSPFTPLTFTAKRNFTPICELDNIGETLSVDVVPVGWDKERDGGGPLAQYHGTYEVHVLVSQRVDFGEAANTQAALLVSLMEQMSYVIARQRIGLPDGRGAVMGPIEASPAYSHPGLILKGVFAGEQGWKFSVPQ